MRLLSRTRQWKRSAERAIAPAHFATQREQLAATICDRVSALRILQGHTAGEEAAVRIRQAVLQTLDDAMICSSLGLRHLDALDESLRHASYEDAAPVLAESQWARQFMQNQAPCSLQAAISSQGGDRFWEPSSRVDRLVYALTLLAVAELTDSELAA